MHQNGIRKLRGAIPLTVFSAIFSRQFTGMTFVQGIVRNPGRGFKQDAAYDFLSNPNHIWRTFMGRLVAIVVRFFTVLTSEEREQVLIIDDATHDRSRSKLVELLAWVHDHNRGCSLKGLKLLTLGWSDGTSFLPLDFVLCSSASRDKRIQGITKQRLDTRSCGYQRRREATIKSTQHLETMVKRASNFGIRGAYILMDRWFCFPAILAALGKQLPVMCLAMKKICSAGVVAEDAILALVDAIMDSALELLQIGQRVIQNKKSITDS